LLLSYILQVESGFFTAPTNCTRYHTRLFSDVPSESNWVPLPEDSNIHETGINIADMMENSQDDPTTGVKAGFTLSLQVKFRDNYYPLKRLFKINRLAEVYIDPYDNSGTFLYSRVHYEQDGGITVNGAFYFHEAEGLDLDSDVWLTFLYTVTKADRTCYLYLQGQELTKSTEHASYIPTSSTLEFGEKNNAGEGTLLLRNVVIYDKHVTAEDTCPPCHNKYLTPGEKCDNCDDGQISTGDGDSGCTQCNVAQYSAKGDATCSDCPVGKWSDLAHASCYECASGEARSGSYQADDINYCKCIPGEAYHESSSVCSACDAGKHASNSREECHFCGTGEWSARGSDQCIECYSGTTPQSMDSILQCECIAGKTRPAGNVPCLECGVDTYKVGTGDAACVECPENSVAPSGSAFLASCVCIAGYEGSAASECTACSEGTHKSEAGSDNCVTCVAGKYSTSSGSPECGECAIAQYSDGTTQCEACPENSFAPAGSSLRTDCRCNAGYRGNAGGECTACSKGKYKPDVGSANCVDCASGKYSTSRASLECAECAAGKYSQKVAASVNECQSCAANSDAPSASNHESDCRCNPGFYGPDGGTCTQCELGKFQYYAGRASCESCAQDMYQDITGQLECKSCPANSQTMDSGSASKQSCICLSGSTGPDGGPCTQCPAGKWHTSGIGCVDCVAGKYSAVLAAVSSSTCVNCPLASHGPAGMAAHTECMCNAGATGPNGGPCQACELGKYKDVTGSASCSDCTYVNCLNCTAGQYIAHVHGVWQCVAQCGEGWAHHHTDNNPYRALIHDWPGLHGADIEPTLQEITVQPQQISDWYYRLFQYTLPAIQPDPPGKGPRGPMEGGNNVFNLSFTFTQSGSSSNYWYVQLDNTPLEPTQQSLANTLEQNYAFVPYTNMSTLRIHNKQDNVQLLRVTIVFAASQCFECVSGQYKMNNTCIHCDAPLVHVHASSASQCQPCAWGTAYTMPVAPLMGPIGGPTCQACAMGEFYRAGTDQPCLACEMGTYSRDMNVSTCMNCPPGEFTNTTTSTTCVQCQTGKFAPHPGATICTACDAGKIANQSGSTMCTNCTPTTFAGDTGRSVCTTCPYGNYSETGARTCIDGCPENYVYPDTLHIHDHEFAGEWEIKAWSDNNPYSYKAYEYQSTDFRGNVTVIFPIQTYEIRVEYMGQQLEVSSNAIVHDEMSYTVATQQNALLQLWTEEETTPPLQVHVLVDYAGCRSCGSGKTKSGFGVSGCHVSSQDNSTSTSTQIPTPTPPPPPTRTTTQTPTPSPTPAPPRTSISTHTPTPTPTPTPISTPISTHTPTRTTTQIPTPSNTPKKTHTSTRTTTQTPTPSPTPTPPPPHTRTTTQIPTPSNTLTPPRTSKSTHTPMPTPTPSPTPTPPRTSISTQIPTPTPTPTPQPTPTPTPISTPINTHTHTFTPTPKANSTNSHETCWHVLTIGSRHNVKFSGYEGGIQSVKNILNHGNAWTIGDTIRILDTSVEKHKNINPYVLRRIDATSWSPINIKPLHTSTFTYRIFVHTETNVTWLCNNATLMD